MFLATVLVAFCQACSNDRGAIDSDLLRAAKAGDNRRVHECLRMGANINATNEFGHTALILSAMYGHQRVAEGLLSYESCSVDAGSPEGFSALTWCALKGRSEIGKFLLARGARIDHKDSYSYTPLHWAARKGHMEFVLLLVERGAPVNATTDIQGFTPLHLACAAGSVRVATALLAAGAKVDTRDRRGRTASEVAVEAGESNIVELLRQTRSNGGGERHSVSGRPTESQLNADRHVIGD